jgi:hypothetical protein
LSDSVLDCFRQAVIEIGFLLLHFVNEETIAALSEEFPAEKRFTQFYRVAKVHQTPQRTEKC